MTNLFRYLVTTASVAIALQSWALAQPAAGGVLTAPPVPASLQVPEGNALFLEAQVQGSQNYVCLPSASGFSWTFFAPQATGFLDFKWIGGDIRKQIITHFLSSNPSESGTARATWQSSFDTSAVWGKSIASSTDPGFVAEGAIPWLLLQAVGWQTGPAGGDILAHATYVHRLNTAGGVAPSTGCSQSDNVGATALVPYTANYFFYKLSDKN